jgi:hypothetical protein
MFVTKIDGEAVYGRMWSSRRKHWTSGVDTYTKTAIGRKTPDCAKPAAPLVFVKTDSGYKLQAYRIVPERPAKWRIWKDGTALSAYPSKAAAEAAVRAELGMYPSCPECGNPLLQSIADPADPYWYCADEHCSWTGERRL